MNQLLTIARAIDAINERIGRLAFWLVLLMALISAGNALARYGLNLSSNAWLEVQWYLFSAVFLLGAGYTLKHNGHVRIDILYGRFSLRTQARIDLIGGAFFLLPFAGVMAWLSWAGFAESLAIGEMSPDAGGLARWPIKSIIPLGFTLLALQGVAEIIKRLAYLAGRGTLSVEKTEEQV